MAGLAAFAVAVLLFAQIVLSADEAKMPAQESLYARSAALIDGDTGRLLYGKEENVILPMASTTKIMTCILVLEMMEPEEICTASAYAASMYQLIVWLFPCGLRGISIRYLPAALPIKGWISLHNHVTCAHNSRIRRRIYGKSALSIPYSPLMDCYFYTSTNGERA